MSTAMYAFSGDPITYGHIDIIKRAAAAFDRLIVGIGVNPTKSYMFTLEERTQMARKSLGGIGNIEVVSFSGLLVDYAYEKGVSVFVKGVRNAEDFSYENVLHQVGESQELGIDTHILFAKPMLAHVSSGVVKDIQKNQGFIHEYVPLFVKQQLEARISGQTIVGVTGEIGSGKSHASGIMEALGQDIPVCNIELDHLGYQILSQLEDPAYREVRKAIAETFGADLLCSDGTIDRKGLGEIVFNDSGELEALNRLMYTPLTLRLRHEMAGKGGLILINSALLAEADMMHICNNNVILVQADRATQKKRLTQRDLTDEQIDRRLASQFTCEQKRARIEGIIERDSHGQMWTLDTSDDAGSDVLANLLEQMVKALGVG